MRVLALVATFNEQRFVAPCIEHLAEQGVDVHLIDNDSTDATVEITERYRGRGLAGIESFPRDGIYDLRSLLERKAAPAATLDADWFLHADPDKFRSPPRHGSTLAKALAGVDRQGYNAANFQEFTFVPTLEEPDHDHPEFRMTMRRYYPFLPWSPHQLKAWKRQEEPVDLATTGGHVVDFPGLRMYPESFPMRHYLFLSVGHAVRKYVERAYDPVSVARGWHGARATIRAEEIALVSETELCRYESDNRLDASAPRTEHPLFVRSRG